MNLSGAVDPLYILARCVLLDALEALGSQRNALILVGAQAIYLHTGPAGLAIPEYTTDADIGIDPQFLSDQPLLEEVFQAAGFSPAGTNVGSWLAKRHLRFERQRNRRHGGSVGPLRSGWPRAPWCTSWYTWEQGRAKGEGA